MTRYIILLILIASSFCYGEQSVADKVKAKRARSIELYNKRTGGNIPLPNSQRGTIVIVNAQEAVSVQILQDLAARNESLKKIRVLVQSGDFSLPNPKIMGQASLFVIDDITMPSILVAPEQRWAMVNVSSLKNGNGSKKAFFEARSRKELARGFALLCGAQTSNYPGSLLGCVTKPEDLDKFSSDDLPVDVPERYLPYLSGYGITPLQTVPYVTACREGWAPAPTNDVQRLIWNQIHEKPSEPLKITFDPKTDTK